ncbi:MAG: hypothetical protein DRR16_02765 [Candidatus Parabeggiatoa sp. nov. 3]|nr:MAG: hypothetical protein DRR00_05035 [Gammaproteobacteria bacterium]RKZ66077.1 MAG: hypothetical protein DRQ99_10770 [Gammaproteobacteria bacterium]RKZ89293.1 MAG: hypothetical protein DRR16_02765 [Gammaproteobacteria bacterium]
MQYPLSEKIGPPDLLIGRESLFRLLNNWIDDIENQSSQSQVIMARRKSGKSAIAQRLFNQFWSQNGNVIPFYFEFDEHNIYYPNLALDYYNSFASQYISFLERKEKWVEQSFSLKKIREYGLAHAIPEFVEDVDFLLENSGQKGDHDGMWEIASSAPERFAANYDKRVFVILEEFQYLTEFYYSDPYYQAEPMRSLAGTYHPLSDSKIAPMFLTSSYISKQKAIMAEYLPKVTEIPFSCSLTPEEGLEAVYKYAEFYNVSITDETAVQINVLCKGDPFFIYTVIQNRTDSDLKTQEGVVESVYYQVSNRRSEMSGTWKEYFVPIWMRMCDRPIDNLLYHISQHPDRAWTVIELKEALDMPLSEDEIEERLVALSNANLIIRGLSGSDFKALSESSLPLILRNRFEHEILGCSPDMKKEFHEQLAALKSGNEYNG